MTNIQMLIFGFEIYQTKSGYQGKFLPKNCFKCIIIDRCNPLSSMIIIYDHSERDIDLKLLSNWYILTKGMLKYYMDAKYHKAANVVSGCEANPNLDSLMKYKNDWGN